MGAKRQFWSICQKKGAVRSIFSFGLAAIVGCGPPTGDGCDGCDAFSHMY